MTNLFMGYLPAGYPDRKSFLSLIKLCCENGMDIAEVGFPSKDPFADGDIIRHAHETIDQTISKDISYWHDIRKSCPCPLWIMGYRADLVDSGFYIDLAKAGLVDAFVIPDNDDKTFSHMTKKLEPYNVDMIPFIRPNDTEEKMRECFTDNTFVYYQLFSGPTGSDIEAEDYTKALSIALDYDHLRILAGFGVNSSDQVRHLLDAGINGFIIGTAMVRELNKSEQNLVDFVRQIKKESGGEA